MILFDHLLLHVGPSNGKKSSSFLRFDLWVNSLIVIPVVDLGHGALKWLLTNSGSHTRKVDFPVKQNSALCLLLCFCLVEEHKLKWEEKIKGCIPAFHTFQSVQKLTVLLWDATRVHSKSLKWHIFTTCKELVEGSWCLGVCGSWGPDLLDLPLSLCIPEHLLAAFLGSAPGTSLSQRQGGCETA